MVPGYGAGTNQFAGLAKEAAKKHGGIGSWLKGPTAKHLGATTLGALMFQRLLGLPSEIGKRNLRREAIQQQAGMVDPESLYLQAALPQAQEEESMARQALFTQLTGGMIGPTLARGETLIGGR